VTQLSAIGRLWGARVDWNSPTTDDVADHYIVKRRVGIRALDELSGPGSTSGSVAVTRFKDTDLEAGRNYTFAVFAVDAEGQPSEGKITHLIGTQTKVRDADLRQGHEIQLRGRVVDTDGDGVSGVTVLIQKADKSDPENFKASSITTRSDADGSYRIALTPRSGSIYRLATPGSSGFGPSWTAPLT